MTVLKNKNIELARSVSGVPHRLGPCDGPAGWKEALPAVQAPEHKIQRGMLHRKQEAAQADPAAGVRGQSKQSTDASI